MRERITYSEFCDWIAFLRKETKEEYYWAQIAAEVRRGHVKDPKTVKVKDFMVTTGPAPVEEAKATKAAKSKQAWGKAVKLKIP